MTPQEQKEVLETITGHITYLVENVLPPFTNTITPDNTRRAMAIARDIYKLHSIFLKIAQHDWFPIQKIGQESTFR